MADVGLVGGSGSGSTIGIGMVDRSWFMFMVHVHGSCIVYYSVDPWSVRGRHTKMKWTRDFHFLIVVTPLTQRCIQE